jgi:CheY-like chemotaxis protein
MSTPKKIMIVDDHAAIRTTVCSLFARQGFDVCAAENGDEAVTQAQEQHPDLVVLDLAMPVMNGFEAARALKRLMPKIPLLMFTGTVGVTVEQEAHAAGIAVVVSKNESTDRLVAQAKRLLT